MGEGWIVVERSSSRRGSSKKPRLMDDDDQELTVEEFRKAIHAILVRMDRIRSSDFYKRFLAQVGASVGESLAAMGVENLVVYGLGRISRSESSRLQLALVLLLRQDRVLPEDCLIWVFDPVLTACEWRILRQLECRAIDSNELGLRKVEEPTLFFMPHCESHLYDNVVKANWGSLGKIAILGNSFASYMERWTIYPNQKGSRPDHLLAIQPRAVELPVDDVDFMYAFNDMSWHFFPDE
ncbi:protein SENSITIVITY TO RED LIGHT REDUCED 1 [Selaginella moellendorffii]|nr:protein SENSITIVITY TO RED LIGHT REDUCED 1 [Selaginella moellendorffii]|eukprot:XP_002978884.2 protein SENSITIVITY TO RED LIGHT REDUCED 1 [Selaginella moellendorffii]